MDDREAMRGNREAFACGRAAHPPAPGSCDPQMRAPRPHPPGMRETASRRNRCIAKFAGRDAFAA